MFCKSMLTPMEKEVNAHPMEKVLLVLGQYTSLSLSSYPFGYDWCVCVCEMVAIVSCGV